MGNIMLPKLYIHIGAHKTGSTYLQKMCAEHESELLDRGVLYLKTGRKYFGHHQLFDVVKGIAPLEETRALVADEIRNNENKTILISSETFEYLNEEEIERLISLFGRCECHIIYFFRNWNDMLHSMWQENVKHGATYNFHMFVSEHIGFPLSSNILNFSLPLRKYAKVVGLHNMMITSYDLVCDSSDLLNYFLPLIGITSRIEHECERVNAGLQAPVVECIRNLNSIAVARGYKPSYLVRQNLLRMFLSSALPVHLKNLFKIMNRYAIATPDYNQCFAARTMFNELCSEFGQSFTHDAESCRFVVERRPRELYVIDPNYLLEPEAREMVMECWVPIEKELV